MIKAITSSKTPKDINHNNRIIILLLIIRKKLSRVSIVDRLVKEDESDPQCSKTPSSLQAHFIQRHCCGWGALPNKQSISLTIKFQMFRLGTK